MYVVCFSVCVVSSIHRCRVTNDQAINVWQSLAVHAFMPSLVRTAVVILHNTRAISILKTLLPDFKGLMSDGSVSFVHLEAGAKGCITPDHRNPQPEKERTEVATKWAPEVLWVTCCEPMPCRKS